MSNNIRQKGQILIEFILIAPVLLAIAGGAIEIARFLRFNQVASVFSQETALTAYRRCSDFFVFTNAGGFDSPATQAAIRTCLNQIHETIQNRLDAAYPSTVANNPKFSLALSVYRRDRVGGSTVGFAALTQIAANGPGALSSLFAINGDTIERVSPKTEVFSQEEIEAMERIVIAEVAYIYSPAIPIYKVLLGNIDLMKTDEGFRETTIL